MFARLSFLLLAFLPVVAFGQSETPPPEKPFTLLLITHEGIGSKDPRDAIIRQWIYRPQTAAMARWQAWASPKELQASSPIVREHHSDILQDAQGLPALALVDSTNGGRWHLMSGPGLPTSEYELARELDIYFAATMEAARNAKPGAVRMVDRNEYDYRLRNIGNGPAPFSSPPGGGGGIFGPNVNMPDGFQFDAGLNTSVDDETRSWVMRIVFIVIGCFVVGCIVFIAVAWIIAEAITDDNGPQRP